MNPDRRTQPVVGPNPRRWDMPPKHTACGKRRCKSYDQAIGYALHLTRRCGHPLRIYACPTCGGWHVTKRARWEDQ